jgi:hypothetical protein
MTYEEYSDQHRQTLHSIQIFFVGQDVTKYVLFAETTFDSIGGAQAGTCQITLRGDPAVTSLLETGSSIQLIIDGEIYWQGYSSMITRSYFFADKTEPKVVIQGVDLNILFDRLILYNHIDPRLWPTGGEAYVPSKTGLKTPGEVPNPTPDREFLINCLKDTDLDLISPRISTNLISEIGAMTSTEDQDKTASTPSAGTSMRGLFEQAANAITAPRDRAGSVIYFISPKAFFVYYNIDTMSSPIPSVSDDGSTDVACRDLQIVRDASHLKNDVFVFAGELNPKPDSKQKLFKYSHRKDESSISRYGRFQHAETMPAWSSQMIGGRSSKIILQENTPGVRISFTIFKSGLYPGHVLSVSSSAFGLLERVPVRAVHTSFDTPNLARFSVTASYDSNDPWGILLAMKRPASRGLIPPRYEPIRLEPGDDPPHVDYYTSVEEIPKGLGGHMYQCSYKYIRGSLIVYIEGKKASRIPWDEVTPGQSTVTDYQERSPDLGRFYTDGVGKIWVSYFVAGNL